MSLRAVIAHTPTPPVAAPPWLPDNLCYETLMGSVAYAVSNDTSDADVYGICLPPKDLVFPHLAGEIPGFGRQLKRFETWQQHHIRALDKQWDFQIYSIVTFFRLAMENNPNIIDALFTPRRCVLSSTAVGEYIREHRHDFLHRGAWHKFKGYAYAQLHKIKTKQQDPDSTRVWITDADGVAYDCHDEAVTEFLTEHGWRRFDDIAANDKLAAVDPVTGRIRFEVPNGRIDKSYSGRMFTISPAMSHCVVTENHSMLVSPCHRNPSTSYSYAYVAEKSDWQLVPLSALKAGKRSWFHVRTRAATATDEFDVDDSYLILIGLMVSEGTFQFRADGTVDDGRFCQTEMGKPEFFAAADSIKNQYNLGRYTYARTESGREHIQETIWRLPRQLAERVYADIGHMSRMKRLPTWTLRLSARQATILWAHAVMGDGTATPSDGAVYYTSSVALADSMQAMLIAAGFSCSIRGPYLYPEHPGFNECPMYQVYLSRQVEARAVDFKSTTRCTTIDDVVDRRVVCFDMPSGTLVTRSHGCPAFHGNCKFAYHVIRLLLEVEMILGERSLDLERHAAQLRAVRAGEWTLARILTWAEDKERVLEAAYAASTLPYAPDEALLKRHLLHCLEAHYGNLGAAIQLPGAEADLLRQIAMLTQRYAR